MNRKWEISITCVLAKWFAHLRSGFRFSAMILWNKSILKLTCYCLLLFQNTAMRPDEELANEALSSSQGSFVSHLFKGLHRSSLTCPHCGKHSNTFDPYLCVSLPLPQKCPRPVFVNVVYSGQKQLKIGLRMNTFESVRDLRHRISKDIRIPESEVGILGYILGCVPHNHFLDLISFHVQQDTSYATTSYVGCWAIWWK